VRLYLVNTANTRVFALRLDGATLKRVGGDSGRCEHERIVDEVLLAPSERAVVDVRFDRTGTATLEHRGPDRSYPIAAVAVTEGATPGRHDFELLRSDPELAGERLRLAPYLAAEPDRTLAFVAEMDTSGHGHDHHHQHGHGHAHAHGGDGIEWEDGMVEVNRATTPATMRWKLVDRATGAENHAIDWRFRVGDRVKLRLVNERDSDHPMHHPFHVHGAGRFLVLARDGVEEPNLAWKDTVLVRTGEVVDILLDVDNPGVWMAHCHIAEHHEGGMMLTFRVDA
jgi:FtsP/CotA-like multicopper oxidase with cupredoxin domain